MAILSSLDFWVPWLALLFVAVAFFGGFKARALLFTVLVTVLVTDGLVVGTVKKLVNRPRPNQVVEGARVVTLNKKIKPAGRAAFYPLKIKAAKAESPKESGKPIEGRSFPSGHTANNFAVGMVIALFYRRRGWLFFFMAAGVSYSRIYTASHWPSDVLFSTLLGLALGAMVVAALSAAWRRWGARLAPSLHAKHPEWLGTPSQP